MIASRRSQQWRSFFGRPGTEQRLLLEAAVAVGSMRLALWLLPSRTTLRIVAVWVERQLHPRRPAGQSVERVGWAIRKVAGHVPQASCLTQALAAQLLLSRHQHRCQLCIGVARTNVGGVEAHAWVEAEGNVVVGGGGLERFTRLPDLAGALSLK